MSHNVEGMQKVPYAETTCVVVIGVFVVPQPSIVKLNKVAKANVGVHHLHQAHLLLLQAHLHQVRLLQARLHQVHHRLARLRQAHLLQARLRLAAQKDLITDVDQTLEVLHVIQEDVVVSMGGAAMDPIIVVDQTANTNVRSLSFRL